MGYIDFSYYSDIYGGKAVPKEDFTIYEIKSRMRIDRQTFNRVKNAIENVPGFQVPEEIKNAQCAIIDYMKLYDNNGGTIVASETVSKHSVTYSGVKSYDDEIKDIVKEFLGGTPWTYMGGGAGYAWDNYITLYNIFRDRDCENTEYNKTVLYVHLEESEGSNDSGTSDKSTDSMTLFVPFCVQEETGKTYIEPDIYEKLDDKSSFFTFRKGDIVAKGNISDKILSEKEFILAHPEAVRVQKTDTHNYGSVIMRHWEVHCN